jgi:hypothetical protein
VRTGRAFGRKRGWAPENARAGGERRRPRRQGDAQLHLHGALHRIDQILDPQQVIEDR